MHSVTIIILHAFAAQAYGTSDVQDPMNMLVDKLVTKLGDRLFTSPVAPVDDADLDSTTLGKIHPDKGLAPRGVAPASLSVDKLIGSNPMAKLAIAAIDATNHGNRVRDVSMMASNMGGSTQQKLRNVAKDVVVRASTLKKEEMAGVIEPTGFFDPLGFTTGISDGKLLFYREVELKHGRVGMLAALGFLVGENFHPLFGGNIDTPAYKAFQETPLETFWPAVVAAIAIPEIFSVLTFNEPKWVQNEETEFWSIKSDRIPGDLGFDPLGLKPEDPEEFKTMQTKELNNGRLAMLAAAGMIAQELATGQKLF